MKLESKNNRNWHANEVEKLANTVTRCQPHPLTAPATSRIRLIISSTVHEKNITCTCELLDVFRT